MSVASRPSADAIRQWMVDAISTRLKIERVDVSVTDVFTTYLDSLNAVTMLGDLQRWLDIDIPVIALVEHPSIESLAQALADGSVGLPLS